MNLPVLLISAAILTQSLPDTTLTPGAVGDTDAAVICAPGYSVAHRIYQTEGRVAFERMRLAVFDAYGLDVDDFDDYELDDRCPVSIGCKQSLENLWPQSCLAWSHDSRGRHCIKGEAADKDHCETLVWDMVCRSHMLTPTQAQAIFLGDWRPWCASHVANH